MKDHSVRAFCQPFFSKVTKFPAKFLRCFLLRIQVIFGGSVQEALLNVHNLLGCYVTFFSSVNR